MDKPTEEHLSWLRHMLGMTNFYQREPNSHRNYAAVSPGDPRFVEMEQLGLVFCGHRAGGDTTYDYWHCTDAGIAAATASFMKHRKPKPARVYHQYLDISDVLSDLSFRTFLTDPTFAAVRAAA